MTASGGESCVAIAAGTGRGIESIREIMDIGREAGLFLKKVF